MVVEALGADQFARNFSSVAIKGDVVGDRPALLIHRPDKSFCMCIAFGARRCSDDANGRRGEPLLHRPAPLRIAIADQDPSCPRSASGSALTSRRHWMTKASSGYGVEPNTCTGLDCNSITKAV